MRLKTLVHYEKIARSWVIRGTSRVPVIETYGSWPIVDMIPAESRAQLAVLANELERR